MCSTDAQADEQCQHGSGRLLAALQCPLEAASPVCATICRMCERSLMIMCCQPIGFWFLVHSSSRSGRSSFERIVAGTAQYQIARLSNQTNSDECHHAAESGVHASQSQSLTHGATIEATAKPTPGAERVQQYGCIRGALHILCTNTGMDDQCWIP